MMFHAPRNVAELVIKGAAAAKPRRSTNQHFMASMLVLIVERFQAHDVLLWNSPSASPVDCDDATALCLLRYSRDMHCWCSDWLLNNTDESTDRLYEAIALL
jgi:hypothetical protein